VAREMGWDREEDAPGIDPDRDPFGEPVSSDY
jgi:hypothetical protein